VNIKNKALFNFSAFLIQLNNYQQPVTTGDETETEPGGEDPLVVFFLFLMIGHYCVEFPSVIIEMAWTRNNVFSLFKVVYP